MGRAQGESGEGSGETSVIAVSGTFLLDSAWRSEVSAAPLRKLKPWLHCHGRHTDGNGSLGFIAQVGDDILALMVDVYDRHAVWIWLEDW